MGKQIALHIDQNYQRQACVCRRLEALGLELHRAPSIYLAEELAKKHRYHLILMHFETMDKAIFDFCSFIRSSGDQSILIALMTDIKTSIEEKLFDCGVNDVVCGKQASGQVLTKRIHAHLCNSKSSTFQTNTIRLKDTIIDFNRREIWCNGTIRRLPGILNDLLKYFLENPGRVISREELRQSAIWAESICSSAKEGGKTFDVNIGKLRKIIEPDPARPKIITSVRGAGWKLAINPV